MKATLRANIAFLIPYLIFLLLGAILLLRNEKADIHLEFNAWHSPFFNSFFHYFTHLGDGWTALLVIIMLLSIKYRHALLLAATVIISGFITQLLKHTFFADEDRPVKFFEGMRDIYLVPGIENNLYNSFPSGHSTCAFAICLSLALIAKKHSLKFFYFCIALLIAYSRVYLSQHFFADVYAGSIIGSSVAFLVYIMIINNQKPWMDRSLRNMRS